MERSQISVQVGQEIHLEAPPLSDIAWLAIQLRREVFVEEQQVPAELEIDEYDLSARCFVTVAEGRAVATLRVIRRGSVCQVSRLAVRSALRRHGVGSRLLQHALHGLKSEGYQRFFLNAQIESMGFYERNGFRSTGDPFDEAGIQHVRMEYASDTLG